MVITALYGYDSEENSRLVNDYPYGNKRCRIRFWIEFSPTKGYRFCSQTEHPTKFIWNKPKKGTYCLIGMCMYEDEKGHVTHAALSQYSSAAEVKKFLSDFPDLPSGQVAFIKIFAKTHVVHIENRLSGKIVWKVAGVIQPDSEAEKERLKEELAAWKEILQEDSISAANKLNHSALLDAAKEGQELDACDEDD